MHCSVWYRGGAGRGARRGRGCGYGDGSGVRNICWSAAACTGACGCRGAGCVGGSSRVRIRCAVVASTVGRGALLFRRGI